MAYTRLEAVEHLRLCSTGKHWITSLTCDSCWVNEHRCPPTLADAEKLVREATELQSRAAALRDKLNLEAKP